MTDLFPTPIRLLVETYWLCRSEVQRNADILCTVHPSTARSWVNTFVAMMRSNVVFPRHVLTLMYTFMDARTKYALRPHDPFCMPTWSSFTLRELVHAYEYCDKRNIRIPSHYISLTSDRLNEKIVRSIYHHHLRSLDERCIREWQSPYNHYNWHRHVMTELYRVASPRIRRFMDDMKWGPIPNTYL